MTRFFSNLKIYTLLLIALFTSSCMANKTPVADMPKGNYKLDKGHASITWKVNHLGLSKYTARFTRFDAELDFNSADPSKSKLMVTIDPTSIKTDYPFSEKKDFDKELIEGAGWFNTKKFPNIKFESTQIEQTGDKTGKVTGNLTFLGQTLPLTLDVTLNGSMASHPFSQKAALGFSAHTTVQRSKWGFNTYVPNIGDNVEVLIEVEFQQQ